MTPESMIFVSPIFVIIMSNRVLVLGVILVGLVINCCSWYSFNNSINLFVCWLLFSVDRKLQLKSPVITKSLSSSSMFCKKFSKSTSNSILASGGRYHVEISRGLLLGLLVSITITSTVLESK